MMHDSQSQFVQRCWQMGLPAWQFDNKSNLVDSTPTQADRAAKWFTRNPLLGQIQSLATQALLPEHQVKTQAYGAYWLVPFVAMRGSRKQGAAIVMVMQSAFKQHPDFQAQSDANAFSAKQSQDLLTPYFPTGTIDISQYEQMLRWSHDDLAKLSKDQCTLDQFSESLSHTYEETNLIYRLGHAMNHETDPLTFVQMMADQVLENLPFGWLAVAITQNPIAVSQLSGQVVLAGHAPCDDQQLKQACRKLVESKQLPTWQHPAIDRQVSQLPNMVNSEVLAHQVTHDGKLLGVIVAGNKSSDDPEFSSVETKFLDAAANFLGIFHENIARYQEQRSLFLGTLQALTASIDAKDQYTRGHSERVGYIASSIAALAGLEGRQVADYRIAGLVHDVGKIGVSESVLRKAGKLTHEEYEEMKKHPVIGYEILKDIPPLAGILPGVLYHHERWDGQGYPQGLSGQEIPLIGRILAVADTFDAMSSTRSYRPAMERSVVLNEISTCAGSQFDPKLASLIHQVDLSAYDQMVLRCKAQSRLAA